MPLIFVCVYYRNGKKGNFYTLPSVKKYMTKHDDTQKEFTGIGITHHCLAVGKTNSGKSNTLMNYIYRTSLPRKGTFTKILLCVKKLEAFNKLLLSELKDLCLVFTDLDHFPSVSEFEDLDDKNDNHYLVVFDDVINDKSRKDVKKINEYFTYGRSKGVHCFFLSQSFFDTERFVRKQVSFVILCGIAGKGDLQRILRDYQFGDVNIPTLENMYNYCKQQENADEINFMKICTFECPLGQRFSKNWLEYLDPAQFYVAEKKDRKKIKKQADSDADSEDDLPKKAPRRRNRKHADEDD
jgi:hypothetical protein